MAGQLRKGAVGSTFRLRILENGQVLNVATASVKTLKLQKPDGTVVERPMSFETDGSNGVVTYVTVADDLDQTGPWEGQIFVTLPSGSWHTDPFSFQVGQILEVAS